MDKKELKKKMTDGLKLTPQRRAVYKTLVSTEEHPSAEKVYEKVRRSYPHISLDTVNRTLLKLNEIGLAFVVEGTGEPKRFDADLNTHQHLRCVKCRKIIDIDCSAYKDLPLPDDMKGFRVLRKSIYIEGLCSDCRED